MVRSKALLLLSVCLGCFEISASASLAMAIDESALQNSHAQTVIDQSLRHYSDGDIEGAIRQLLDARDKVAEPELPSLYLQLARYYVESGAAVAAETALSRARSHGAPYAQTISLQAKTLLIQGKFEQALDALKGADVPPDDKYEAFIISADAYFALGSSDRAKSYYENARLLNPADYRSYLGSARLLMRQGDLVAAATELEVAARSAPKNSMVRYSQGVLARIRGDLSTASDLFDHAIQLMPANLMARLDRAAIAIDMDEIEIAEIQLDQVYARTPRHPMARYLSAVIAARQGDFVSAQSLLMGAGQIVEKYLPALFVRGIVSLELDNLNVAVRDLSQVLEARPTNVTARHGLAVALLRQGQAERSLKVLQPLLSVKPVSKQTLLIASSASALLNNLGLSNQLLTQGRSENAVDTNSLNSALTNRESEFNTRQALLSFLSGNLSFGAEQLSATLRQAPNADTDIRALALLFAMQIRSSDLAAAKETYDRLSLLAPDRALTDNIRGTLLYHRGELDGALRAYGSALEKVPNYHTAWRNRALVYIEQKDFPKAVEELKKYTSRVPSDDRAKALLAKALLGAGRHYDARLFFEAALKAFPNNAELQIDYLRALYLSGAISEARKNINKALHHVDNNIDLMGRLGSLMLELDMPARAATLLARRVAFEPKSYSAHLEYGIALMESGLFEGARRAFKNAEKYSKTPDQETIASWYHISALVKAGRNREALKLMEGLGITDGSSGKALTPPAPLPLGLVAQVYISNEQFNSALQIIDMISLNGNIVSIIDANSLAVMRADIFLAQGDFSKAVKALEVIDHNVIDSPETSKHMGDIYMVAGDWAKAAGSFAELRKVGAADAVSLSKLAYSYLMLNNGQSWEVATQARKLLPKDPYVLNIYGWVALQANRDIKTALAALEESRKIDPQSAQTHYHLAMAYLASDLVHSAKESLEQSLKLSTSFHGSEEAKRQLDILRD